METLKSAISLIDEKIIGMAHLEELPHDIFRDESYESIIGTQKALSSYPDAKNPHDDFQKVYHHALGIIDKADANTLMSYYQLVHNAIDDAAQKINKAENVKKIAERDLEQSEQAYRDMIKNHSISLLSGLAMEDGSIDLAAISQTSAQQRMKNAYNAVTLLTLKSKALKKIKHHIVINASERYYQETLISFQSKLKDFSVEFDKLKAVASFANMGNQDHSQINEIIRNLETYPSHKHRDTLLDAIQEGLTNDANNVGLVDYINQQYEFNLKALLGEH